MRVLVPTTAAAAGSLHEARGTPHTIGTKLSMTVLNMHEDRGPLHEARGGSLPGHDSGHEARGPHHILGHEARGPHHIFVT